MGGNCLYEDGVEPVRVRHLQRLKREAQLLRRTLNLAPGQRGNPVGRVPQHRNPGNAGRDLLQQLQALGRQIGRYLREPGHVAAGSGEAGD